MVCARARTHDDRCETQRGGEGMLYRSDAFGDKSFPGGKHCRRPVETKRSSRGARKQNTKNWKEREERARAREEGRVGNYFSLMIREGLNAPCRWAAFIGIINEAAAAFSRVALPALMSWKISFFTRRRCRRYLSPRVSCTRRDSSRQLSAGRGYSSKPAGKLCQLLFAAPLFYMKIFRAELTAISARADAPPVCWGDTAMEASCRPFVIALHAPFRFCFFAHFESFLRTRLRSLAISHGLSSRCWAAFYCAFLRLWPICGFDARKNFNTYV